MNQATPDYNAALADARKAAETAQALADDYRRKLDATREALVELMRANVALNRDLRTIRDERDGLMSQLGEACQGLTVGEE